MVQIVRLDRYIEEEFRYQYTVLAQITNYSEFVDLLNNLTQSVNWGDPFQFNAGLVVIRVEYLNGDFDQIYHNAQWFNREGKNQSGNFFFDKEQYEKLVSDYLN